MASRDEAPRDVLPACLVRRAGERRTATVWREARQPGRSEARKSGRSQPDTGHTRRAVRCVRFITMALSQRRYHNGPAGRPRGRRGITYARDPRRRPYIRVPDRDPRTYRTGAGVSPSASPRDRRPAASRARADTPVGSPEPAGAPHNRRPEIRDKIPPRSRVVLFCLQRPKNGACAAQQDSLHHTQANPHHTNS